MPMDNENFLIGFSMRQKDRFMYVNAGKQRFERIRVIIVSVLIVSLNKIRVCQLKIMIAEQHDHPVVIKKLF